MSATSRSPRPGDDTKGVSQKNSQLTIKEGSDRVVSGIYFRSIKRWILKHSPTAVQMRLARSMGYLRNFDNLTRL